MDKIFIGIFIVAIVPYLGFPQSYDMWITLAGVVFLLYAIYRFVVDNDIKFVLPQDNNDDFLSEDSQEEQVDEEETSDPTAKVDEEWATARPTEDKTKITSMNTTQETK